jgi:hypothetical protein
VEKKEINKLGDRKNNQSHPTISDRTQSNTSDKRKYRPSSSFSYPYKRPEATIYEVDNISQLTAEHPIEGISIDGKMYVFFTTNLMEELS